MRSWKTTFGGSLAAVGTFLWGVPLAMTQFDGVLLSAEVSKWCVIIGLVASASGVLFAGLFGRDNDVSTEEVKAIALKKLQAQEAKATAKIEEIKRDTETITKPKEPTA